MSCEASGIRLCPKKVMRRFAAIFMAWLVAPVVNSAEVAVQLRVIPEIHHENASSPFSLGNPFTEFGRNRSVQEAEMRSKIFDINVVATAQSIVQEDVQPASRVIANEIYYEAALYEQHVGLGKKILSWGVGFGFRPLDVIQQEDRREVFTTTLEGVHYLAWEKFTETSAWMAVVANPGQGKASRPEDDESLALKYFLHAGNTDWHAVARASERYRFETGFAFTTVIGEGFESYVSMLYQRRYERLHNRVLDSPDLLIVSSDPVEAKSFENGVKSLVGFTWTGISGMSVLAEAWYDPSALSASEWRAVIDLAHRQASLIGTSEIPALVVQGNIAYSTQYFQQTNLLRKNLLWRISYRQEAQNLEPALDLLYTPEDGGAVATLSLAYSGNRDRFDAGIRFFGGKRDSAYRSMPEDRIIYFAMQVSFGSS